MAEHSPEPPELDESLVQRLAELAAEIDGSPESMADEMVAEFNSLAGTNTPYLEFQGISGGEDHEDYVRRVLIHQQTTADPTIGRNELIEMFRRVLAKPNDQTYLNFVLATIERTFGDDQVSNLIFWPGEYFGDGDDSRELTPEQMADAVLDRHQQKNS
ncbi:hypothetical protein [Blastopirellula marina]|uniref:Uncharacterized protein n=1 Tax=Blastopirellula marina TaxID=124 RepID=A0A2S8GSI8_9BACT|nr:hypothetical protein [Blastopirellula marina]PQO46984.1 hypothetical protein C5Y93_05665 [Blastopirellula marina]